MLNPTREVWKIIFLSKGVIFQFHVSFWGSTIFKNFRKLSYVYTTVVSEIVTSYHNWRFNFFKFLQISPWKFQTFEALNISTWKKSTWRTHGKSVNTPPKTTLQRRLLAVAKKPSNKPFHLPKTVKNKKNIHPPTHIPMQESPVFLLMFLLSFYPNHTHASKTNKNQPFTNCLGNFNGIIGFSLLKFLSFLSIQQCRASHLKLHRTNLQAMNFIHNQKKDIRNLPATNFSKMLTLY